MMSHPDGRDARARLLALLALGAIETTGCQPPPPPPIWPQPPAVVDEGEGGWMGCGPEPESRALEPEFTLPNWHRDIGDDPRSIDDVELQAMLEGPDLELCADNPFGPDSPRLQLDFTQRDVLGEALYARAQRARPDGDLACARALFETGFYYVWYDRRFVFEIAEMAAAAEDCEIVGQAVEYFLYYAHESQMPEMFQRARELRAGCGQ